MAGRQIQKNHALVALIFGIIKVVMACITLICSFVISSKGSLSAGLTPYWAGAPCLIPGILGIIAGCTKSYCVMVGYMVLSIIASVISTISFIIVALAVGVWSAYASGRCYRTSYSYCTCVTSSGQTTTFNSTAACDVVETISTMLYVLVIVLAIVAGILLAGSILGCIATCCKSDTSGQVIQQQPLQGQHMQVVTTQQAYAPPAYQPNSEAGPLPPK